MFSLRLTQTESLSMYEIKHITHRYITSGTRGGAWIPAYILVEFEPGVPINTFDEAGAPLILGSG